MDTNSDINVKKFRINPSQFYNPDISIVQISSWITVYIIGNIFGEGKIFNIENLWMKYLKSNIFLSRTVRGWSRQMYGSCGESVHPLQSKTIQNSRVRGHGRLKDHVGGLNLGPEFSIFLIVLDSKPDTFISRLNVKCCLDGQSDELHLYGNKIIIPFATCFKIKSM